jgi:hypothetical protein
MVVLISGTRAVFAFDLRFMTRTIAASTIKAMSAPTTMPAIVPPPILFFCFFLALRVDDESDAGVGATKLEAVDSTLDETLPIDVDIVEAEEKVTEVDAEDKDPPSICASLMTLTPEVQQSLLVPQHHSWLSALPVQGVTWVFPPSPRDEAQMSRHFPDA